MCHRVLLDELLGASRHFLLRSEQMLDAERVGKLDPEYGRAVKLYRSARTDLEAAVRLTELEEARGNS